MTPGRLLLVPTPLDFGTGAAQPLAQVLPAGTLQAASQLTFFSARTNRWRTSSRAAGPAR